MGDSASRFRTLGIISFLLLFMTISEALPAVAQSKRSAENTGDILQILLPAAGFTTTLMLGDHEGRNQFTRSFFLNMGVTGVLKVAINRPRPEGKGGYSFPSGHTSASFQGASFIQIRYGWKYGIPAYAAASYVGWSRVYADKHYFSDVVAGAAIGILSSYIFTSPFKGAQLTPTIGKNSYGIVLKAQW